jgi:hypothetical protein
VEPVTSSAKPTRSRLLSKGMYFIVLKYKPLKKPNFSCHKILKATCENLLGIEGHRRFASAISRVPVLEIYSEAQLDPPGGFAQRAVRGEVPLRAGKAERCHAKSRILDEKVWGMVQISVI